MKNYHEILGVSEDASEKDIKKAYRNLAAKYHPDRNNGDKDCEEKFKEISEAYQTLSDKNKREEYDLKRNGSIGGFDDFPFGGFNPFGNHGGMPNIEDIMNEMGFGQRGRGQAPRAQGHPIYMGITVSLEEVLSGCNKQIDFSRESLCETCSGKKHSNDKDAIDNCSKCQGYGQIGFKRGMMQFMQTCPKCSGAGFEIKKPCTDCAGKGTKTKSDSVNVKIPAGIFDGASLRVAKRGHAAPAPNSVNGDLLIEIGIKKHPTFERVGDDLYSEIELPYHLAVLGGEINVPSLGTEENQPKNLKTKVPRGLPDGKILEFKGKGLPNIRTGERGNQFVEFKIKVPDPNQLNKKQIELLRELSEEENKNTEK